MISLGPSDRYFSLILWNILLINAGLKIIKNLAHTQSTTSLLQLHLMADNAFTKDPSEHSEAFKA